MVSWHNRSTNRPIISQHGGFFLWWRLWKEQVLSTTERWWREEKVLGSIAENCFESRWLTVGIYLDCLASGNRGVQSCGRDYPPSQAKAICQRPQAGAWFWYSFCRGAAAKGTRHQNNRGESLREVPEKSPAPRPFNAGVPKKRSSE